MKLVQFSKQDRVGIGHLTADGQSLVPLAWQEDLREYPAEDLMVRQIWDYAAAPASLAEDVAAARKGSRQGTVSVHDVTLLAPIRRPAHDVLCVGVNYMDHVKESTEGLDDAALSKPPASTIYFSKRVVRMTGPGGTVRNVWDIERHLDYEAELAVIIGKGGRHISKEEAEEHIFGYSVFNDISGRETQKERIQWYMGKSVDTYSCLGPVLVTREELPFPLALEIGSRINGEERQRARTDMLLRDVPTLIQEISSYLTLEPGDIIATGTPSGVAMGMKDPMWLRSGDEMECYVEGIGTLRNRVE